MSALFDLFRGKKKRSKRILVMGEWLEEEYIQYCAREDRTLKELEANLHITDDPEEIAIIVLPDTDSVKDSLPYEYSVYQRLRANAVPATPFKPNPVGFLVIRNPKRCVDQPSMMAFLAYVLHRAMAQKKTMDSAKMTISPENITKDTDVIIHLLGNLDIYTSKGVIREADFKSPNQQRRIRQMALSLSRIRYHTDLGETSITGTQRHSCGSVQSQLKR